MYSMFYNKVLGLYYKTYQKLKTVHIIQFCNNTGNVDLGENTYDHENT